jgi:hypothetical protein
MELNHRQRTIFARYTEAMIDVTTNGLIEIQTAQLVLALALRDLEATKPDIHQANGGNGEKRVDLRTYEWLNDQIARINDWLAEHEPALYCAPDTDTAEAMICAADRLRGQVAKLRSELATCLIDVADARQAHATACDERD